MKIMEKYEKEWQNRLIREPFEDFFRYERNWVLPPLFKHGEKVLDLASGNSIVGEFLKKKFNCQVIALDISASAVNDAKRRGVGGQIGDAEKRLPFENNTFDLVFWGDNIEHVFFPEKIMLEIHRVLRPKGHLILSTPNQAYWRYRIYTFLTGKLPKTEGEDNPPWEWTHIRFFTREILKNLFTQTGFREAKFLGASRRRIDRLFLKISPELFGMIAVVEAVKTQK
jgi:methionine biosynthesis protein MetW